MVRGVPGLFIVGSKVGHCAAAGDPQFAVFIARPFDGVGQLTAGNRDVHKVTGLTRDAVFLCKFMAVSTLGNIQNHLVGAHECAVVDVVYSLRNIHALQSEAIAEAVGANVGHGLGQDYTGELGQVVEGQNAYLLQLAALFKLDLGHILGIAEGIVADGGDVLANDDLLDQMVHSVPGLVIVGSKVGHCAAAGDFQRAIGVKIPKDIGGNIAGRHSKYLARTELKIQTLGLCKEMTNRVLGNLKDQFLIRLSKCIGRNGGNRVRHIKALQPMALLECAGPDSLQLAVLLKVDIGHCAAVVECTIFQDLNTCGEGYTGQIPVVTKGRPADNLQGRVFFEGQRLHILNVVEAKSANFGNAVADFQSGNGFGIILDDPGRVETVGGVILHNTLAIDLQQAAAQQDILDVGAAEAGIHNRRILRGNKRALFIEIAGVAQDVHLAADGNAVGIVEVDLGIDVDFTGGHLAGGEIAVGIDGRIQEEAIQTGLIGANALCAKVIVEALNLLQTGELHAVHIVGIAIPAVGNNHAVLIGLAVGVNAVEQLATSALQHAVGNSIGVAGGRNGGAPIHNGVTTFAEGAAGVAVFGAGGCLVSNSLCGVHVATVPGIVVSLAGLCSGHVSIVGPHLGIAENALAGKGSRGAIYSGQNALIYIGDNRHSPEFLHGLVLRQSESFLTSLGAVFVLVAGLQCPDADGDGEQSSLTGLIILAGAGYGQSRNVIIANGVLHREAGSHSHMIQLPGAVVVQIQHDLDCAHFLNGGSHQIHVVDGSQQDPVSTGIGGHQLDGAAGLGGIDGNVLDHTAVVAHVVTGSKLDRVLAIGQVSVCNGSQTVGIVDTDLNAVNIGLDRGRIHAGVIILAGILLDCSAEGDLVGSNRLIVQHGCIGHTLNSISHIGNDRCLPVIHSAGVVDCDIIQIELEFGGDVAVLRGYIVVGTAVTVRDIELHQAAIVLPTEGSVSGGICVQIMPARFAEGIHHAGAAGTGIHRVGVNGTSKNRIAIGIKGDSLQSPTGPQTDALIGDVEPAANADSVLEHLRLGGVDGGLHVAGLQRVAIVNLHAQGVFTTVDLAGGLVHHDLIGLRPDIVVLGAGGLVKDDGLIGAVFEVVDDLRALAQLQHSSSRDGFVQSQHSRQIRSGSGNALFTGREAEAGNRANGGSAQSKLNIAFVDGNSLRAVGGLHLQGHSLAIGNRHGRVRESDGIGCHHI